jgi:hypothetical protein
MQGVPVGKRRRDSSPRGEIRDKEIVIPFFQIERERFLEYDIASLIFNLGTKGKPVVAVYSSRPMFGDFQMQMRGLPATPWSVIQQLQNHADVKQIFEMDRSGDCRTSDDRASEDDREPKEAIPSTSFCAAQGDDLRRSVQRVRAARR